MSSWVKLDILASWLRFQGNFGQSGRIFGKFWSIFSHEGILDIFHGSPIYRVEIFPVILALPNHISADTWSSMSRSFRKSYLGYPFHSPRGWYQGKLRQLAKKTRYISASFEDEDGAPIVVRCFGRRWNKSGGRLWHEPDRDRELHVRNAMADGIYG